MFMVNTLNLIAEFYSLGVQIVTTISNVIDTKINGYEKLWNYYYYYYYLLLFIIAINSN